VCLAVLDLMAGGPHWRCGCGVDRAVWLPFIGFAGYPGEPVRKNVPAQGGACVLIHRMNAN
jgi:hypothetical protein